MHKDNPASSDRTSASTPAALISLSETVGALIEDGGLDTRFGEKLLRDLRNEAALVEPRGHAGAAEQPLGSALARLGTILADREATLLVAANLRLREADESESAQGSGGTDPARVALATYAGAAQQADSTRQGDAPFG